MAQQAQQQPQSDNSLAPVWLTILLFVTLYIIWAVGHKYIVAMVFNLNVLQAKILSFFIDTSELSKNIYLMETIDPSSVSWGQMIDFTRSVSDYMRYPILVILVLFAFFLYKSNVTLKFRKVHDMKTLRAQEQYNWPAIMPVVKQDLVETDINTGPWAMALSPLEFARKYQLLKKDDVLLDNPVPGQEMTAGIRRGDAKRVFTLQLGPYWDGFEHCPPHVRALAAVFMARMNRDRESATKILDALDKSCSVGKPDYTAVDAVLKKYQHIESVQEILGKHAYLMTVMASLIQASRSDGVVPSAEFLWLKPIDRRLWYMLNCVGRQTPYAEVFCSLAR